MKEGTKIHFKVKDGVFVQQWIVGKKREGSVETTHEQAVFKKDAVKSGDEFVIKAEIVQREPFDFSIIFDPNKVSCKNGNDTVENKGVVKEGTELTLTALGLQLQDHENILWRFGRGNGWGERGKTTFKYKVRARDAYRDDIHEMKISWEKR